MSRMGWWWIGVCLAACDGGGSGEPPGTSADVLVDADGDGVSPDGGDCDDADPEVGASVEVCDGKDQDCDGLVDEGATDTVIVFVDADGDGFGAIGSEHLGCAGAGDVLEGGDCDDALAERSPGAVELCNGADDDCDPDTTEGATVGEVLYATVAAAIDAAADGDLVTVCPGVHREAGLLVSKALTIEGATDDPADTVLDGESRGGVFQVDGGALTLERLTVRGGNATAGGAVSAVSEQGGVVTATSCVFEGNTATDGGALAVRDATLTDVRFLDNVAEERGGAVYQMRGVLIVAGSTFEGNRAVYGGGLAMGEYGVSGPRTATVEGSTFTGNVGLSGGGAVDVWAGEVTLSGCTVDGNESELGGGGLSAYDSAVALSDTVVSGNVAFAAGGIDLSGDSSLSGGTFTDNRAVFAGGAISAGFGREIVVDGVTVIDNAAESGGGIEVTQVHLQLVGSVVAENAATTGGGIYVTYGSLTVIDTEIRANSADEGGGLELQAPASLTGGALIENVAARGAGASFDERLTLDGTDLGADATDNVGADLESHGAELHGLGAGTQASCRFVPATDTIVCEPLAPARRR